MQVLELFSGVGGWRCALDGRGSVVAAYDISPHANATYTLNHGDRPHAMELASVARARLLAHGADTWVLSPPCQPFCRMGKGGGLEDARSRGFLSVLELLEVAPPERLLLENVAGFLESPAFDRLVASLDRSGLAWRSWTLCPTQFGIPNQRPRVYVAAARQGILDATPPAGAPGPLAPWLDPVEATELYLSEAILARHKPGLDLVRPGDHRTACFIGGYGQRYVGSGSFLVTDHGIRRFSVGEVARLLGYPEGFRFPESVPMQARYKLLGNGLSIPVAHWVAQRLPS